MKIELLLCLGVLAGSCWATEPVPDQPIPLLRQVEDAKHPLGWRLDKDNWTFQGDWHWAKIPDKQGGYTFSMMATGFCHTKGKARVSLASVWNRLSPAQQRRTKGWRLEFDIEFKGDSVFELSTLEANGSKIVLRLFPDEAELFERHEGEIVYARTSTGCKPSKVWLEWDGKTLSVGFNGNRSTKLIEVPKTERPEFAKTKFEFAFTEVDQSAVIHNPRLQLISR